MEYVPVHTFVRDFVKGQTYALELAFCPELRNADRAFRDLVMLLREYCLTRNVKSMVGYCKGQAMKYSVKGDRLNAVKDVQKFLFRKTGKLVDYESELAKLKSKHVSFEEDETHVHLKVCDKLFPLSLTTAEALSRLFTMEKNYGNRARKAAEFDGADWKALMHACRVSMEAEQLLTSHRLTLPFEGADRKFLLSVRKGEVPFENVTQFLETQVSLVEGLAESSSLPDYHDVRERADDFLLDFVEQELFHV